MSKEDVNNTCLLNLWNKHKPDKPDEYLKEYSLDFLRFKNQECNVLEIGVGSGRSICVWHDFFVHGTIYAMDFSDRNSFVVPLHENVIYFQGDQGCREDLALLSEINYDIIIDDASHLNEDIQLCFGMLFPCLKSGGIYYVEDLNYRKARHPRIGSIKCPNSASLFSDLGNGKGFMSPILSIEQCEFIEKNAKNCQVIGRLARIIKK